MLCNVQVVLVAEKEIGFASTSVRLLDEPRKTFAALFHIIC